jgi:FkbM family methyltransferase
MFISYSQNFEDVILNRLFAEEKTGFYIDVGAQHPYYDSVTKAFYDRGWQGINIEPVKEYYQLLQEQRERDINLNLAAGEVELILEFYELEGTGLSTFDRQTAEEIATKNNYKILPYQVPIKKLADICAQYATQPINFLKIDVEGWEENVILGHDWQKFRPIVVLLEATIPNSPVRTETKIEQILASKNYEYVYFDGLNDYYLAREHIALKQHFQTPPNVFDKFISSRVIEAQNFCQQKEQELHILNNKYQDRFFEVQRLTQHLSEQQHLHRQKSDRYIEQINHLQNQFSQVQQLVTAMETSKFWKMRSLWFKLKKLIGIKEN